MARRSCCLFSQILSVLLTLDLKMTAATGKQPNSDGSVPLHPVLLIHGYFAGRLVYTVDRSVSGSPSSCSNKPFNETLWLNLLNHADPASNACWTQAAIMHYDDSTGKSFRAPGVRVHTLPFGPMESVEYLAPVPQQIRDTSYFKSLIDRLVDLGYTRDKDLQAAPYDWRRAPNENQEWLVNVKKKIEQMHEENDSRPVIVISHCWDVRPDAAGAA